MFKKRGMSPIVATVLLIAFAVALGAMVMTIGKNMTKTDSCEDAVIDTENL